MHQGSQTTVHLGAGWCDSVGGSTRESDGENTNSADETRLWLPLLYGEQHRPGNNVLPVQEKGHLMELSPSHYWTSEVQKGLLLPVGSTLLNSVQTASLVPFQAGRIGGG